MRRVLVAMALLGFASATLAQDLPFVRVEVTPAEIAVGEPIRLRVTVLAPTWFPQPPTFPSFEISNAIVRLPPDSSRATSERVNRETWAGIVRNYQVYPLIGATYRLDDLTMRVTYADPGDSSPVTVDIDVPPIEFRAVVPTGAESLHPYIAGRALTLTRDIGGNVDALEVGDALVIRYTAELDGLPAIFLPTLVEPGETPGVSVYADQAEVGDDTPARRSEKLTYVFNAGGDFEIPAATLDWWNTETSTIETASVSALTISVMGPPVPQEPLEGPAADWSWLPVIGWVLVLFVAMRFLLRRAATIRAWWLAYQKRRHASEEYAFDQLRKALHAGDTHAAHDALLKWLDRFELGMDAREFARKYGDAALNEQVDRLSRALYSGSGESINPKRLERSLVSARRRCRYESRGGEHAMLPPLNP